MKTIVFYKITFFLLFLGLLKETKAQNLVLNPSFENVNAGSLQCSWYTSQAQFNSAILNWTCPTGGSSDIFSNGLATSCWANPNSSNGSALGFQAPRTGSVMVGGHLYGNGGCSPYREYFQGRLSSSLTVGTTYKIEFYLSLGDNCNVGSTNFGVKFGTAPVNVPSMCVYAVTPDVNYSGAPITNKTGWTKVEFCYTPTSPGLQYFMIGNFFNNVSTATVTAGAGTVSNAYYFLDDVSISTATPLTPTLSSISNCSSSTTTLTALPSGLTYTWVPPSGGTVISGINSQTAIVSGSGVFTLSITNAGGCTVSNSSSTIAVTNTTTSGASVLTSSGNLTCSTPTVLLSTTLISGATYTWSGPGMVSGINTNSLIANVAGNYTLISNNAGCVSTGTISITQNTLNPTVNVSPATVTLACNSSTLQLLANTTPTNCTFLWTAPPSGNLNNVNIFNPISSGSGQFSLSVINPANGCSSFTTVSISPGSTTPTLSVNSASLCGGASVTLSVTGNATNYTWQPAPGLSVMNATSAIASPTVSSTYTVVGSVGSCSVQALATVTVVPLPVLSFNPVNPIVCQGQSATLTVSGASSYTWSPASTLNTSNTSTVISTPITSTTYSVDGELNGCFTTNTLTIVVGSTVVVTATASTYTICPNGTTTLSASGASSYTWSPGLGLNTTFGSSVIAQPTSNQTYTVVGATATCTNSAQIAITVTTNPIISVSNVTICAGQAASLTASGANTYTWSPSIFLNSTNGPTVISTPPLNQSYTVTGSSLLGCNSSTTASLNVVAMPVLNLTANSTFVCPAESTTLLASGASDYSWQPNLFLSNISGSSTVSTPLSTIIYSVTGSNGIAPNLCSVTKTIEIIVKPTTTISVVNPSPICLGNTTKIDAHGGNYYSWLPPTGIIHTNDSIITVKPLTNTIYTVTVTKSGYCANTATVEVLVNPLPNVDAGLDTVINMDESVVLFGTGDTEVGFLSPENYPLNCNLCPVIKVNPQQNTCFVLKGTNQYGCSNFDTVCVIVSKDWNIYIPNAFSPNGDGINDYFMPKGYGVSEIKLNIFDRWGALIFVSDTENPGWDGKFKGLLCEQGVYVYQVEVTSMNNKKLFKTGHVTLLPKIK